MKITGTIYDFGNDENIKRLRTYYNYLKSVKDFLVNEYGVWQDYGSYCVRQTIKVQGVKDLDLVWINRWLKIAWNTEYLINAGPDQIDLIRINNQWLPIKAYYCLYSASEAYTYALNKAKSGSHAKARKVLTEYFERTKIKPWNFICDGTNSNIEFQNFPIIRNLPSNLKQTNIVPHEMLATCLHAEHKHRINENFIKRKRKYKKDFNPGFTSLFHFFYRLRIKSNYRDIDLFITSASDEIIIEFADSLKEIVFWFLLLAEIYLVRRCKKRTILDMVDDYLANNPNHELLKSRIEFITNSI